MTDATAALRTPQALPPTVGPKEIIDAACRLACIPASKLFSRSRKISPGKNRFRRLDLVRIRAACAWIMRERLDMSLPEIGAQLGYSDHTTVLHHLRNSCTTTPTRDAAAAIEAEARRAADELVQKVA